MNRVLNGESFPKPGLMKRIFDYFQVDVRILLQPLAELEDGAPSRLNPNTRMAAALYYALYGQDFTVSAETKQMSSQMACTYCCGRRFCGVIQFGCRWCGFFRKTMFGWCGELIRWPTE